MNFESVLKNTSPSGNDNKEKILNNIILLNQMLNDAINNLNSIKTNLSLNINALRTLSSQETAQQEIISSYKDDLQNVIRSHQDIMSTSFNDEGILCKILFTDGTCFSSGLVNIFGGAVYIHDTYPNLSCIYTSNIKSTFEAEFTAITMALREAVELTLNDIINTHS